MRLILFIALYGATLAGGFYIGGLMATRSLAQQAHAESMRRAMSMTFVYVHAMTGKLPCELDLMPPGFKRDGGAHTHTEDERRATITDILSDSSKAIH